MYVFFIYLHVCNLFLNVVINFYMDVYLYIYTIYLIHYKNIKFKSSKIIISERMEVFQNYYGYFGLIRLFTMGINLRIEIIIFYF